MKIENSDNRIKENGEFEGTVKTPLNYNKSLKPIINCYLKIRENIYYHY